MLRPFLDVQAWIKLGPVVVGELLTYQLFHTTMKFLFEPVVRLLFFGKFAFYHRQLFACCTQFRLNTSDITVGDLQSAEAPRSATGGKGDDGHVTSRADVVSRRLGAAVILYTCSTGAIHQGEVGFKEI